MCFIFVHQMLYGSPYDARLQIIVPDRNLLGIPIVFPSCVVSSVAELEAV